MSAFAEENAAAEDAFYYRLETDMCADAAKEGRLDDLKLLISNGHRFDHRVLENAASGGHLPILQFMNGKGRPMTQKVVALATEHKHAAILQWLASVNIV
jgi:hypothetical protein